jgi:hypothetical protein
LRKAREKRGGSGKGNFDTTQTKLRVIVAEIQKKLKRI